MPPQQRRQHQVLTIRTVSRMLLGFALGFVRYFFWQAICWLHAGSIFMQQAKLLRVLKFLCQICIGHMLQEAWQCIPEQPSEAGWVTPTCVTVGWVPQKIPLKKTWKLSGFQLSSFQRLKRHATAQISMASCTIPVWYLRLWGCCVIHNDVNNINACFSCVTLVMLGWMCSSWIVGGLAS